MSSSEYVVHFPNPGQQRTVGATRQQGKWGVWWTGNGSAPYYDVRPGMQEPVDPAAISRHMCQLQHLLDAIRQLNAAGVPDDFIIDIVL